MRTEVRLTFNNFDFFEPEGFAMGFDREEDEAGSLLLEGEKSTLRYTAEVLREKADEIEEELNG